MTDRYHSLTVGLEYNIRKDDAEALINAILMIRGVIAVEGNVSDSSEWIAKKRVESEYSRKLFKVLSND
jgi:hypothetical protein